MDTSSFERITRLLFRCGAIAAIAQLALSVVENSDEGGIDIAMWAYTHGLTLKLWLPFVHVLNIYYRHQTSDFVGALVLIFAAFLTYIDDRNLTRSDVHKGTLDALGGTIDRSNWGGEGDDDVMIMEACCAMCAFGQTIALVGWSAYVNGKHGPIQRYLQQILTWKNFVVYALINAIREELYSRVLVFGTFLLYAEHLRNDDDKTAWMVVVVFANVLQAVQFSLMHVGGGFPSGWWPGGVLVFIWALLLVTMRLWAVQLYHSPFETTFDALKLSGKSLHQLHEAFATMDFDSSGEISLKEFFKYLNVRRTGFTKRCFTLFDYDESGELDFREFVVSLWNYCTSDSYALMSFAFDLYDLDGSGMISKSEMVNVVREVYGGKETSETNVRAQNIIVKLQKANQSNSEDLDDDGEECDKFGFVKFCKRHPALLFPAFMLQETLRNEIIGRSFWSRLAKNREREFGKDEIDINWLRARVTRNAFVEIAETIGFGDERKSLRAKVLSREEKVRYDSIEARTQPTQTADVVRKLSCGIVVEAWDGKDGEVRREWVRLKEGGWVRKKSFKDETRTLLQEIVPEEILESAMEVCREWMEKDAGGDVYEKIRSSVKRVINAAKSSQHLRNVVAHQQRLVLHAQAHARRGRAYRNGREEEEEEDDDGPV
eukprot:g219.t1